MFSFHDIQNVLDKFASKYLNFTFQWSQDLPGIYLFRFNNRNTRRRYEICSELTIKTPERLQWCRSGVFIVNLEHILHLPPVFLLLTLNMLLLAGKLSTCVLFIHKVVPGTTLWIKKYFWGKFLKWLTKLSMHFVSGC